VAVTEQSTVVVFGLFLALTIVIVLGVVKILMLLSKRADLSLELKGFGVSVSVHSSNKGSPGFDND